MTPEESFELTKKKGYLVVKGNDLIQRNRFELSLMEQKTVAYICSINLSRVPRPYFNMGVGECVLTDTLSFPLIPNILFYCVQTVFTNR